MDIREVRFTKGTFRKGVEYSGCCNTGNVPIIGCPTLFHKFPSLNYRDIRFQVGPELHYKEATLAFLMPGVYKSTKRTKTSVTIHGKKYRFFKTKKAALSYFQKLNQKILEYNNRQVQEKKELIEKAKEGDLEAAYELSDF